MTPLLMTSAQTGCGGDRDAKRQAPRLLAPVCVRLHEGLTCTPYSVMGTRLPRKDRAVKGPRVRAGAVCSWCSTQRVATDGRRWKNRRMAGACRCSRDSCRQQ